MRKIHRMALLILVMSLLVASMTVMADNADVVASPTSSSITLNGKPITFTAYNINGSNYFKLRDLAAALNGTNKKFSVDYDSAKKMISLETGLSYAFFGGELALNESTANKSATPTAASLFCNEVNLSYTAYNIDGANYFKLRDIMQILDVSVSYDDTKNAIAIDTNKQYVYEKGIIAGTTLPPLRIKGNWPMGEKSLQTSWAKCYPLYATYLGLPTKILTEGIAWEWDDSIVPDTVGYSAVTNSMQMGPLPHHYNFDPRNHEDYEPVYMQNMHETGHLFWQMDDKNLSFDFGQWIWEANSLIGEILYKLDYYKEFTMRINYDLMAYHGPDKVNGVRNDGNKYGTGGRTMVDGSATNALVMLSSVMSYDSGYDFFSRVNGERVEYFKQTGKDQISKDAYGSMLDKVANGRTIDGMKPSKWLLSQPVANIQGPEGVFMTIEPSQSYVDNYNIYSGSMQLETALYRRTKDSRGDLRETAIVGTDVNVKVYDSTGKLLTQTTKPSPVAEYGSFSIPIPTDITKGAYRIEAVATVDGKTVPATTFLAYNDGFSFNKDQMALILLREDGTIRTDAASDLKISGYETLDMSAASEGFVLLTAKEGSNITVQYGSVTKVFSMPYGGRIIPVKL